MSTATKPKPKSKPVIETGAADFPYILKLRDGRRVLVELPAKWAKQHQGELVFTREGAMFLDRIRAVLNKFDAASSSGHVRTLREVLGMTQQAFGAALGVDKLTISRWERGEVKPGQSSIKRLRKLQSDATRRGVVLGS